MSCAINASKIVNASRIAAPLAVGLATLALSLGSAAAKVTHGDKDKCATHRVHAVRRHASHHWLAGGPAEALPYKPENGFLSHIPANAIRMPGYTFVPGVGILGASCDLPTSACSNQYRDIQ